MSVVPAIASRPPLSLTVQVEACKVRAACTELDASSSAHRTARAPSDRDMLTRARAVGSKNRSHRACEREKVGGRMLVAANVILGASAHGIYTK